MKRGESAGAWFAIGMGIGTAVGVAVGNLALGLGIGMAIGAGLAYTVPRNAGNDDDQPPA
ncbi:MAG: hypothetical protein KDD83_16680 [Caldilineaceae bacterium]|nr:hypothetical protein [Caldilineaceae bacterium]